jgi:hypothetical protein
MSFDEMMKSSDTQPPVVIKKTTGAFDEAM